MMPPLRGDVVFAYTGAITGRERGGTRPVVVVSSDLFNSLDRSTVFVIPFTTFDTGLFFHLRIEPPEGGLREVSYALCELLTPLPRKQIIKHMGYLDRSTMTRIESVLIDLLALHD